MMSDLCRSSSSSSVSVDSLWSDFDSDAGTSFGEIALISEDAVRNASIVADDMTDLMVIDRGLFDGTLKAKQEAEYLERKNFIKKCALFRNWSSKFRRLCEMSLRKLSLPFDSVIIKQGEPVTGLHFIVTGQGKVIVDPELHKTQYPKVFEVQEDDSTNELWPLVPGKDKRRETKPKETSLREQIRVRRREGYAAAERRLAQKTVTMCYVDESEILGDTELILGLDTYTQTVVCAANTEVFILDNKNIERLIYKKNPHTLDKLRQIVETKLRSRTWMRVGSQISLYKRLLDKLQGLHLHRPTTAKQRDDENRPKTVAESAADRDLMVAQLSKLFIQNKAPFIEPSVPGSLYYLTKAAERARRRLKADVMQASKGSAGGRTGVPRLYRVRNAPKRQPRSRRELERLTRSPKGQEKRQNADNVVQLGYNDIVNSDVKEVVKEINNRQQTTNANQSKLICSMLDKQNETNDVTSNISRPRSAPTQAQQRHVDVDENDDEEEDEMDSFDWETSNHALKELEDKLRAFYAKNGSGQGFKKYNSNVVELKRFTIQSPEDVPIPGGTVYVRQRVCQFAGGAVSNSAHHQHVRRYIIPRDAYKVAVRSLSAVEGDTIEQRATSAAGGAGTSRTDAVRPLSSAPRAASSTKPNNVMARSRIQSAPMKRSSKWS